MAGLYGVTLMALQIPVAVMTAVIMVDRRDAALMAGLQGVPVALVVPIQKSDTVSLT
jgi:hypothetical protein